MDIEERLCCLGDTIRARGGLFGSATRIRSGWCKFRDLLPFLASRDLPLEAKGRSYSACVRSVIHYGRETWQVKEEDVIRLERNDARMAIYMCNNSPKDKISAEELRTIVKLKSVGECLQDRRLQ